MYPNIPLIDPNCTSNLPLLVIYAPQIACDCRLRPAGQEDPDLMRVVHRMSSLLSEQFGAEGVIRRTIACVFRLKMRRKCGIYPRLGLECSAIFTRK